ncbi:hypothetical protein [Aureispira sp. CCB-E]|uniref:hypothetical protein n=1 Tax=Aureispira sp. CCB-E TaxID=3051121 RepID=UPI002869114F|nr:hypothetical protein [Aureispira sp. CCB-E]WMX16331.1 hypothetical protein QP953_08130 [Aureispira sp. CCB-E]
MIYVISDKNFEAFSSATLGREDLVGFKMPNHSNDHLFLFDSEFEGYDFLEKDFNALIGRKFKFSHRIDQLREDLTKKYGESINYQDKAIYDEILASIKAIYDELHYIGDLPRDLEAFVGIKAQQFHAGRSHVLIVYEHQGGNGASLQIETAATTNIWNYGPHDCYTMAALPDLGLETMSGSTSWNEQISSRNFQYVSGADAMGIGYYKHRYYLATGCNYIVEIISPNSGYQAPILMDFDFNWPGFLNGLFCGPIQDNISSISVKAIWQGCYTDDTQFDDLF